MIIDPSIALQRLIYARLTGSADLAALVPPANILDRNGRPEVFPCVLMGAGHSNFADRYESFHEEVFADLHIWTAEPGTTDAKAVAGAIRAALRDGPWTVQAHRCHSLIVQGATHVRDPDNIHTHAVVTVRAILQEVAA